MIDAELTLVRLNTDVNLLKSGSCKNVYWACADCGTVKLKPFRSAKKIRRCISCSNSRIAKSETSRIKRSKAMKKLYDEGFVHPIKGKKRPQHVRDALIAALRDRQWSSEMRSRHSIKFSGENNPFYGKRHKERSLEKMRVAARRNVRRGKDSNFYGRRYWTKGSFTYRGVKMKSNWERLTAKYFDDRNIEWDYEPETFDVVIDGQEGSYTPDFLIEKRVLVEVKGFWYDDARAKFDAFQSQYPNQRIVLYDKEKLRKLNIL